MEKIIVNFLMNGANEDELKKLTDWLKVKENAHFFDHFIDVNYALDINMNEFDSKGVKKALIEKIKQDKNIFYKLNIYRVMKYVAAAVIVFGLGYYFQKDISKTQIETVLITVNTPIEPGTDKATLTLEDGSHITLEKGESFQTQNANSDGEAIVYNKTDKKSKEVKYNYLTIPRGGQFHIVLSDDTEVWLNSESQLKYPVAFIEGEIRQVELLYGEAYFDVSPSKEHNGSDFMVFNQSQEVKVLGTEFNVKAYKDETNIYTTLVEGKVDINIENRKQSLEPNQQLNLNLNNNAAMIEYVDVYNEVSWKDGVFSFENKPLHEIMKVLSRWYDVEIVFKNKSIENEIFDGIMRKSQSLDKILASIKNFKILKNYEINDKEVIIE